MRRTCALQACVVVAVTLCASEPVRGAGRRDGKAFCGPMCIFYAARAAGIDADVDSIAAHCLKEGGGQPSMADLGRCVAQFGGRSVPVECDLSQIYAWNVPAVLQLSGVVGAENDEEQQIRHFALFVGLDPRGNPALFEPGSNVLDLLSPEPPERDAWHAELRRLFLKRALLIAFPPVQLPEAVRKALAQTSQAAAPGREMVAPKTKAPSLPDTDIRLEHPLVIRSRRLRAQPLPQLPRYALEAREAEMIEALTGSQAHETAKLAQTDLDRMIRWHQQRLETLRSGKKVFQDAQKLVRAGDYQGAAKRLVFFEDHVDYAPQASLLSLFSLVGTEEHLRAMRLCCKLVESRRLRPHFLHVGIQAAAGSAARIGNHEYTIWCNAAMIWADPTNAKSGFAARVLDRLLTERREATRLGGRP